MFTLWAGLAPKLGAWDIEPTNSTQSGVGPWYWSTPAPIFKWPNEEQPRGHNSLQKNPTSVQEVCDWHSPTKSSPPWMGATHNGVLKACLDRASRLQRPKPQAA